MFLDGSPDGHGEADEGPDGACSTLQARRASPHPQRPLRPSRRICRRWSSSRPSPPAGTPTRRVRAGAVADLRVHLGARRLRAPAAQPRRLRRREPRRLADLRAPQRRRRARGRSTTCARTAPARSCGTARAARRTSCAATTAGPSTQRRRAAQRPRLRRRRPAGHGPHPIQVESWRGMVFVCLDPDIAPLHEWLGGSPTRSPSRRSRTYRFHSRSVRHVTCNWKTYGDNFMEGYHLPHGAPGDEPRRRRPATTR